MVKIGVYMNMSLAQLTTVCISDAVAYCVGGSKYLQHGQNCPLVYGTTSWIILCFQTYNYLH